MVILLLETIKMKKLLFIFLIFPFLVFGQAEKTHRSIVIDSLKAFNGGIIDVKDTLKHDIGIKFNDGTFQSTAATGGDSSFVVLQVDSVNAFNNSTIVFDTSLLVLDVVNNRVGIGTTTPSVKLEIQSSDNDDGINIRNSAGNIHARLLNGSQGGQLGLRNLAGTTNHVQLNSISPSQDFVQTGNNFSIAEVGFGSNASAKLHVRGINATSSNFALKIQDNVGTNLLHIRNDGFIFMLGGSFNIGKATPTTSAVLDIVSTTGAVLFPRMTTAQRDALTAVNGMVIYNVSLDKLQVRAGGAWVSLH